MKSNKDSQKKLGFNYNRNNMWKQLISMALLSTIIVACGGSDPVKEKNAKELKRLRSELKTELRVQSVMGSYADFTVIDSLKLLIAVTEGKVPKEKFDAFVDSIAQVRAIENYAWTTEVAGNPIDGEWRYANTSPRYGSNYLKLEQHDSKIWFLFMGSYFCDDNPYVDIALKVNGEDKIFKIRGTQSSDSKAIIISMDFANEKYFKDFESSDSIYVRVNESHCDTEVIESSMAGVKEAIKHFDGIK